MASEEMYRQEIVIDVNDEDAIKRVERAEQRIEKVFKDMERRGKALGKQEFSPLVDMRDELTDRVQKAENLLEKIGDTKVQPLVELRGNIERDLKTMQNTLEQLDREIVEPKVTMRDRVTDNLRDIGRGLRKLAGRTWEITLNARDRVTNVLRSVGRGLTSMPMMVSFALAGAGVGKSVSSAMNFEQYEMAMEHFLEGNKKKTTEMMKWLEGFADATPFDLEDLFPSATRAVGISNTLKDAKKLVTLATDMAALTPGKTVRDAMEALADAQMHEFERMKEFQIKMTKEQYEAIGGWEGFIRKVHDRVDGGAEKLSKLSSGRLSTIFDKIKSFFRSAGFGILDAMKPRLDRIVKWFE
nr:hypothetical protein 1 [bacterium]